MRRIILILFCFVILLSFSSCENFNKLLNPNNNSINNHSISENKTSKDSDFELFHVDTINFNSYLWQDNSYLMFFENHQLPFNITKLKENIVDIYDSRSYLNKNKEEKYSDKMFDEYFVTGNKLLRNLYKSKNKPDRLVIVLDAYSVGDMAFTPSFDMEFLVNENEINKIKISDCIKNDKYYISIEGISLSAALNLEATDLYYGFDDFDKVAFDELLEILGQPNDIRFEERESSNLKIYTNSKDYKGKSKDKTTILIYHINDCVLEVEFNETQVISNNKEYFDNRYSLKMDIYSQSAYKNRRR